MRSVIPALALAAGALTAATVHATPVPEPSNHRAPQGAAQPVSPATLTMVQEDEPPTAWVKAAQAAGALEAYDNFVMSQPRVNVSLYAMSRCPDARMCEDVFGEVLKHEGIYEKVDLSIDFIGKVDKDATYGVECKHGDVECAGNAHELCLQANLDLKQWYSVVQCMNWGKFPGAVGAIAHTRKCVETNGMDYWRSGVGPCIEGHKRDRQSRHAQRVAAALGWGGEQQPQLPLLDADEQLDDDMDPEPLSKEARQRLRDSVRRTKDAGVEKSCTIRIASTLKRGGLRECVVDGGVWKGCDDGHNPTDFVRVIEDEFRNLLVDVVAEKDAWHMYP